MDLIAICLLAALVMVSVADLILRLYITRLVEKKRKAAGTQPPWHPNCRHDVAGLDENEVPILPQAQREAMLVAFGKLLDEVRRETLLAKARNDKAKPKRRRK